MQVASPPPLGGLGNRDLTKWDRTDDPPVRLPLAAACVMVFAGGEPNAQTRSVIVTCRTEMQQAHLDTRLACLGQQVGFCEVIVRLCPGHGQAAIGELRCKFALAGLRICRSLWSPSWRTDPHEGRNHPW